MYSYVLQECEAFDQILGRLLNAGLLSQARELADIFNHNSADLAIVLVSMQTHAAKPPLDCPMHGPSSCKRLDNKGLTHNKITRAETIKKCLGQGQVYNE